MPDKMADTGSRLSDHMANIKDEAVAAVGDVKDGARDAANRYAKNAKAYAQQSYNMALEKGTEAKETAESFIGENPWKAVGIALGAGFLLGFLLRRSSRA